LVVGSHNEAKVAEIRAILEDVEVEVVGVSEAGELGELDEPYETFSENACAKALQVSDASGLAALADDSGLEVDALGGRPGVFSSRYGRDDGERVSKLLDELAGVPDEQRSARFVCVIALAYRGKVLGMWEGQCEGMISRECRGSNGFGYDPVFYYPEHGCTLAEMSAKDKNEISHRGRALRALKNDIGKLAAEWD
jgi:XTP/dITP diphosphohydrolase